MPRHAVNGSGPSGLFFEVNNPDGSNIWRKVLPSPFELTNIVGTLLLQAEATDCQIVIAVALVPTNVLFPPEAEEALDQEGNVIPHDANEA